MTKVAAVAIGKNEGTRLHACLRSLVGKADPVVYVDSGSTDGSVEFASNLGVHVVELDMSVPFTAARARNAGVERVKHLAPDTEFVQFVDGDCEIDGTWISDAERFLVDNDAYAIACGRRRERHPEASVYNYLCDVEWDTPIGDADACGGDALVRLSAFDQVGGFNASLIAGEEPELCVRLRRAGWKIRRLDHEMTLHDAAMTRFSQWWQRAKRAGHAFTEGAAMHGRSPELHWVKPCRRIALWGLALPALALGLAPFTLGLSLLLLLAYPLNMIRVGLGLRTQGHTRPWTVAFFNVLSRLPEASGQLKYYVNRLIGRRPRLIEYKG